MKAAPSPQALDGRPVGRRTRQPQQARSRRTRERALKAAVECFEERGYDETTTAMIAGRAGMAVGTLYGYFTDKCDILLELLERDVVERFDDLIQRLEPDSWSGRDPREWSRSLIDMIFHSQHVRPGMQRIMWERYFKDPEFRAPFEAVRAKFRIAIEGFIDGVEAEGLLRDIDRETAASVILNAVQWNATQVALEGSPRSADAAANAVADMVIRFLFVDSE